MKNEKTVKDIISQRKKQYKLQSLIEEEQKASYYEQRDSYRSTHCQPTILPLQTQNKNPNPNISNSKKLELMEFIPCINCEEHVPLESVDHHSLICNTVSVVVRKMKKSSIMKEIDFKLEKIHDLLQRLMKKCQKLQNRTNCNPITVFSILQEIVNRTLEIQKYGEMSLISLLELKKNIQNLEMNNNNTIDLMIYIERLKLLLDLKYIEIDSNIDTARRNRFIRTSSTNGQNSSEIGKSENKQNFSSEMSVNTPLENEYQQFRENSLQSFQESSQRLDFSFSMNENQIAQMKIDPPAASSFERYLSPQTSFSQNQNINFFWESLTEPQNFKTSSTYNEIGESVRDLQDESETQRNFFNMCLKIKLQYPSHAKLQQIPLNMLYQECISQQIEKEDWNEFLKNCFLNPDEFFDKQDTRTINSGFLGLF